MPDPDTTAASAVAVAAIALRVAEQPGQNDWCVVLAPRAEEAEVTANLVDALRAFSDGPVDHIRANSADDVIAATHKAVTRVIAGMSEASDDEWARLDQQRSQLLATGVSALVLTAEAMDRLARHAPNLHSWIAGAVWAADTAIPELSAQAVEDRLRALRAWSGRSDAEVIALAERGELPGDPEYAAWLVLLDRDDLLVQEP